MENFFDGRFEDETEVVRDKQLLLVGSRVVLHGLLVEEHLNLKVGFVAHIGSALAGVQLDAGQLEEVKLENLADALFGLPFDPREQTFGDAMNAAA